MKTYAKIKALEMKKKKYFRILLLLECILILVGIAGLFGKNAVYEYSGEELHGIALERGSYRVQLDYVTDTDLKNNFEITADDVGTESLLFNAVNLFSGWNQTDEELWLLRDTEQLNVTVNNGEGNMEVSGLTILQTNAMNRIYLFVMIVLFTVVNILCVYVQFDKEYCIPKQNKTVTFLLGLTVFVSAAPLMLDYMWPGGDLIYHLMRVEGIKDGILAGQFPIRISPEWQQGYGYASPIFYGETVLYIAALFRLIGFSVTTAYRLFMFVITVATVLIAYYCFKKIFANAYIGVFCSALYSLSIYRIYKTYGCGSWGECFGIMFMPLIVYGFYRVFTQDVREKSYKRSWLLLTIGFSMLLQSHLLSCEMVGFFTIILCVLLWKKVFCLQTFTVLAKTVIYSILLSAWFLVPFLDYTLTGNFVIHNVSGRTIQNRGLYPAQLLFTFFENGNTVFFEEKGMADSQPMGVGIVLIVALLVFAWLLFSGKADKLPAREKKMGKIAAGFGVVSMVMSLSYFPWDSIQSLNPVFATLISSIQFPNRLLTIANVCLTCVAGVVAKYMLENERKEYIVCYFAGMLFCLTIGSIYLTENMLDNQMGIKVYNEQGMGTAYISGAEYLPYSADASLFRPHDPVCSGAAYASEYERQSLMAGAHIVNNGEKEENVAFDLLYYKGYRAYDTNSGEELNCYAGENFEVTVDVPAGFDGSVEVRFESPLYWKAAELVTLGTLVVMVVFCYRQRWGNDRLSEEK